MLNLIKVLKSISNLKPSTFTESVIYNNKHVVTLQGFIVTTFLAAIKGRESAKI